MSTLYVHLFGRIAVQRDGETVRGLESQKAQEVFAYLLLHRRRTHCREALASLFWGDQSTAQSKKSLRQILWLLHSALDAPTAPTAPPSLQIEPDWVQINQAADLWVDVSSFEQAIAQSERIPGEQLTAAQADALQQAVALYRSDLLDAWYHDWCLFERERLQTMYLATLDKLMAWCEAQGAYETGLGYGYLILRLDRARERTHRRLMRLHYLSGDRAAALRQYKHCVAALLEELHVEPARRTQELHRQICADQIELPLIAEVNCLPSLELVRQIGAAQPPCSPASAAPAPDAPQTPQIVQRLRQLISDLGEIQRHLASELMLLEVARLDPER